MNTKEKCKNTIADHSVDDQKRQQMLDSQPLLVEEKVVTRKPSEERHAMFQEVSSWMLITVKVKRISGCKSYTSLLKNGRVAHDY